MQYGRVERETVAELARIVGEKNVLTDAERLKPYSHDETEEERYGRMPEAVVKPGSAEQISEILLLANRRLIPVTPRGAGSGLSGGAIPVCGGIVVSLERMNRILEIDYANMMAVVEPGVVTNEINEKVARHGLFFAGYPMSIETCFIGGNVAENAGGGKAVKYGVTGRYITGLQVVIPTGEILTLGGKLLKDVTGYDLKQIIIGSEGTLGIVTRITIRLLPLPTARIALLALFRDVQSAIDTVPAVMTDGRIVPTSIEFMDELSFKTSCSYLNEHLDCRDAGAMLLIEVDGNDFEHLENDAEQVGELCLGRGAIQVYVADNRTTIERVWSVRRSIAEAFSALSPRQSLEDIVVPVAAIPELLPRLKRISERFGLRIPCYGHAGDGNIHATLVKNPELSISEWHRLLEQALEEIYAVTRQMGGAISGEHGIGSKRKRYLQAFMDPAELDLMRRIKTAFDPNNIMNPGKIFDMGRDHGTVDQT
jgi:glycolate oxidase